VPIGDDSLRELIKLCKEEFGEKLTPDEARAKAGELLAFYHLACLPLPKKEEEEGTDQEAA